MRKHKNERDYHENNDRRGYSEEFAKVLIEIGAGEEITVLRRGKPVAKIAALGPKGDIDWPDFYHEAIPLEGKPVSQLVMEGREDRI